LNPTHDRRVRQGESTFGHHLHEITKAEFVAQIPAHAEDDYFAIEMAAFEEFVHVEHSSALSFEQSADKLCGVNPVRTRAFDITLAIRLRWPRPVPLIVTKILDPTLRSQSAGRRPTPGDPAWPNAAAGAIALAAAAALDLAADLTRRSETLPAVAPKLRSKPAQRIVDLMLAQDCVSPAEAARHAPMSGRAARRLFDRLVLLGAPREFSGRPTFRLYGL
jgi:Protein of unknown function (DUF1403)